MTVIKEGHYLALIKDDPNDDSVTASYSVYLINNTDEAITELAQESSGWVSFGDELVKATGRIERYGRLSPQSAVKVGSEDEGSFDFTITWTFAFKLEDGRASTARFSLAKYGFGGRYCVLPILESSGQLLSAA